MNSPTAKELAKEIESDGGVQQTTNGEFNPQFNQA
jgi:hypothetical protein